LHRYKHRDEIAKKKRIKLNERKFTTQWNVTINSCNISGIFNKHKQTFEILKYIPREKYGCDCIVSLPKGLTYNKFVELQDILESGIGIIMDSEWKRFDHCIYIWVVDHEPDENIEFKPVKLSEHQLYFGLDNFYKNIVIDMYKYPHALISGATNMGKSVAVQICLTNLIYYHPYIELYFSQLSDKQDFYEFRNCKQVKAFSTELKDSTKMFQYLMIEMKKRNEILIKDKSRDIIKYNEKHPDKPMHCIYIGIDEFADYIAGLKGIDLLREKKIIITNYIDHLIQKGRNVGIFFIIAVQRPDSTSMLPSTKKNMNTKIAFGQNSLASSQVVIDTGEALGLKPRNAIFVAGDRRMKFRTLYFDDDVMHEYIKKSILNTPRYINLDNVKLDILEEELKDVPLPEDFNNEGILDNFNNEGEVQE
jgi:hypothetical protein